MRVLLLGLALATPGSAGASCPTSRTDLRREIADLVTSYPDPAYAERLILLEASLYCVEEVLSPEDAAQVHYAHALSAFMLSDSSSVQRSLCGMRSAVPRTAVDPYAMAANQPSLRDVLDHPAHREVLAVEATCGDETERVRPRIPGQRLIWIDGVSGNRIPSPDAGRSAILQQSDRGTRVVSTQVIGPVSVPPLPRDGYFDNVSVRWEGEEATPSRQWIEAFGEELVTGGAFTAVRPSGWDSNAIPIDVRIDESSTGRGATRAKALFTGLFLLLPAPFVKGQFTYSQSITLALPEVECRAAASAEGRYPITWGPSLVGVVVDEAAATLRKSNAWTLAACIRQNARR